jgi:hypothetical protein
MRLAADRLEDTATGIIGSFAEKGCHSLLVEFLVAGFHELIYSKKKKPHPL